MRVPAVFLLAFLVSGCSQVRTASTVTDLTPKSYISIPRINMGSVDGFATYRTHVGSRSNLRLSFTFTQRVVRIEFVSNDNWFDHHADAQMYVPIPAYNPECQPDPVHKLIDCQFGFAGGSSGFYLYARAVDAGTFHYAVKLSEEIAGTGQWRSLDSAGGLLFKWDEIVTA
jgi:hypothetical protein